MLIYKTNSESTNLNNSKMLLRIVYLILTLFFIKVFSTIPTSNTEIFDNTFVNNCSEEIANSSISSEEYNQNNYENNITEIVEDKKVFL